MGHFNFARGRKTSVLLVLASTGLGFAGCGTSPDASSGTAGTSAGTQAGTAGVTSVAGATATAGGSSTQAGSGTGGSGTSGSATTAGASGSTSGGASAGAGGTSSTGGGGGSGGSVDPSKLDKFSFFVTSMAAMQKLSKSQDGFGGDLRYGTADGLTGADKICTEIAESSMPGASAKQWHAFLSTTKVNAKDRIGMGPWYDRTGRLVSQNLAGLLGNRPAADAMIKEDLPNETGTGNHRPNPNAPEDDNHHTLTGSKTDGTLYSMTATCKDWTSRSRDNTTTGAGVGRPQIGFSWSTGNRTNWISGQTEGGCDAGVTGVGTENGGSDPGNPIVGSGGGYGGIYCFALVP